MGVSSQFFSCICKNPHWIYLEENWDIDLVYSLFFFETELIVHLFFHEEDKGEVFTTWWCKGGMLGPTYVSGSKIDIVERS
jgi:hypothetical protein